MQENKKEYICYELVDGEIASSTYKIIAKNKKQAACITYTGFMKQRNIQPDARVGVIVCIVVTDRINGVSKSYKYACCVARIEIPNAVNMSANKTIEYNYKNIIKKIK